MGIWSSVMKKMVGLPSPSRSAVRIGNCGWSSPLSLGVVQRIVASANRLHSRDATPVASVPLAVVGVGR